MKQSWLWILLSVCCSYQSCTKSDEGHSASYQISGREWTSDYVSVQVFDGYLIVEIYSSNEFDVNNQIRIRVSGTQVGDYPVNSDMFESVGFMTNSVLKWDQDFFSSNHFYPDTVSNGQVFSIKSIDLQRKIFTAEFSFSVINASNGRREHIRGSIRKAEFTFKLNEGKFNIFESFDDDFILGIQNFYGYNDKDYTDITFGNSITLKYPENLNVGNYDVSTLPRFYYYNTLGRDIRYVSGTITISERNQSLGVLKGFYQLNSVNYDGSSYKIKGYFTDSIR